MNQPVSFTTSDGVAIAALHHPATWTKFVILLHMMPATKESWEPFMAKLAAAGFDSVAIDERGHGASTQGGTLLYRNFTDEDQKAKIHDVEAAFEWLKRQGATEANTSVVGSSIGANLAIEFFQEHPAMLKAAALSPGLDYRGVLTEPFVTALAPGQSLLIVASDDDRGSYASCERLVAANPAQVTFWKQSGLGHANHMFDARPELMDELIQWLN